MPILRAFLALLAGFASMAAVVGITTAALTHFAPAWVRTQNQPRISYVFINLGYSLIAAALGGYITARIAGNAALNYTLALAVIVLLLGALSALQQRGSQPISYQLLLVAIMPVGVFLGGVLRIKAAGI